MINKKSINFEGAVGAQGVRGGSLADRAAAFLLDL